MLASLNYPNIGSIYGLEEAEGVRALVLVEGPTLADRIAKGPIQGAEAPGAEQLKRSGHETGEPMRYALTRRQALALIGIGTAVPFWAACGPGERAVGTTDPPAPTADSGGAPLHYMSLRDVARLIEAREFSPVELTETMLDRIAAVDGRLKSYATVMRVPAMAAARAAEAEIQGGRYRGPLHGVPIAVKDLCYTRGVRTMGALAVLRDFVPDFDATVVARLQDAGAIILGKLNLTEGAMAGYHPDFDIPVNPWDGGLWTGVSSSGSGVATAAGLCFGSLGSDTGGSIRFPAAQCGLVGLKPTWGRVSRYGVLELAGSLDHIGPMTRSVADAAIMFEAIAGVDPNDATTRVEPLEPVLRTLDGGVGGVRLGIDRRYASEGVDPAVSAAVDEAVDTLAQLGAEVVDVEMPAAPFADWGTICSYEAARAHAGNFPARADEYGPYFGQFLANGSAVTDQQYADAGRRRAAFSQRFHAMLASIDALVCPSNIAALPLVDGMGYDSIADFGRALASIAERFDPPLGSIQLFTAPADFAGTPTISLPCGFSANDAPYSLQLVGRDLSEATLCRIAHAYEQATGWHTRHPDV